MTLNGSGKNRHLSHFTDDGEASRVKTHGDDESATQLLE